MAFIKSIDPKWALIASILFNILISIFWGTWASLTNPIGSKPNIIYTSIIEILIFSGIFLLQKHPLPTTKNKNSLFATIFVYSFIALGIISITAAQTEDFINFRTWQAFLYNLSLMGASIKISETIHSFTKPRD